MSKRRFIEFRSRRECESFKPDSNVFLRVGFSTDGNRTFPGGFFFSTRHDVYFIRYSSTHGNWCYGELSYD